MSVSYNTNMDELRNKCRGMLVGLAVGDALGAPVEPDNSSEAIMALGDDVVGEMRASHLPKGVWTDDTSMALCLADSLITSSGYDSWDVMERYVKWLEEGYRCYFDNGIGVGLQTYVSIGRFMEDDPIIRKDEERHWHAGNGTVMRLAPAVIAAHPNQSIEDTVKICWLSARETHYSVEAEAATEIFGAVLYQALELDSKDEIIDVAKYSTGKAYDDALSKIMDYKDSEKLKDLGGYVIDCLRIAVWGFMSFDNFEKGMIEIIKLGGDTDTNAAVYGQLAGAYYGFNRIPQRWLTDLYLRDEIVEIADRLLEMEACSVVATRFEEDVM